MPARITDILAVLARAEDGSVAVYDIFAEIFGGLDARLAGVEAVSGSLAEVQSRLEASGEALVEQALGPVRTALAGKADLGALLTASSISEIEIGTGLRTLVVTPEAARAAFAPAHILSIVASDDPTQGLYARRVSYDATTGELLVDVLATLGAGTRTSWTIAPASLASVAAAVSCAAAGDEISGPTLQAALGQIAAALAARQPAAPNLTALGGLALAADRLLVTSEAGGLDQAPVTAAGLDLIALASLDAMRGALGAAPVVSPSLTGTPTVPTPSIAADSSQIVNVTALRAAVAGLVGSTPAALDTLNELASALGNDANFAATMTTALAAKLSSATAAATYAALGGAPSFIDLALDDAAGSSRFLTWKAGGLARWAFAATGTAEAGANAGSDFTLSRYSDAGAQIGVPLTISRATGDWTLSGIINSTGQIWSTGAYIGVDRTAVNATGYIAVKTNAGYMAGLALYTGATTRWTIGKSSAAEAGADVGSDFIISRYSDAGAGLGTALTIDRATGNWTIGGKVTAAGEALANYWHKIGEAIPSAAVASVYWTIDPAIYSYVVLVMDGIACDTAASSIRVSLRNGSTALLTLIGAGSVAASTPISGEARFALGSDTTNGNATHWGELSAAQGSTLVADRVAGGVASASAVNRLYVAFGTGNIKAGGKLTLYGVRRSN